MKLQAKARLLAVAISREQKGNLPAMLTPLLAPLGIEWAPVKTVNMGDMYPSLGRVTSKKAGQHLNGHFSVSLASTDMSKGLQLSIGVNVELSNSIYQGNATALKYAQTAAADLAKALKKAGKVTLDEPSKASKVQVPRITLVIPTKNLDLDAQQKYGIRVVDVDGKAHVFTSTQHSNGPWTKDEATMHIHDLQDQLKYDDDFKRATDFRVVPV